MAKQTPCPICFKDLLPPEKPGDKVSEKESQVTYWMHDPANIHVDVEVRAHKECYDKVKKVYKELGQPTQTDYEDVKYPIIKDGIISMTAGEGLWPQE